jgi:hypothetical protein
MSYTGTKLRDSLNTIGMLGLKALHVEVAEAIMPQGGSSEPLKAVVQPVDE